MKDEAISNPVMQQGFFHCNKIIQMKNIQLIKQLSILAVKRVPCKEARGYEEFRKTQVYIEDLQVWEKTASRLIIRFIYHTRTEHIIQKSNSVK